MGCRWIYSVVHPSEGLGPVLIVSYYKHFLLSEVCMPLQFMNTFFSCVVVVKYISHTMCHFNRNSV